MATAPSDLDITVGVPITKTIGEAIQWREAVDKSKALRDILDAWKDQSTQERGLRSRYAGWLAVFLAAQIASANAAFYLAGFGVITFDQWTARLLIVTVFSEIGAMVFFIVKYLFSRGDSGVLALVGKLYSVPRRTPSKKPRKVSTRKAN